MWARNSLEFEQPASGPGPVVNTERESDGTSSQKLVGDYNNPILKPAAAEHLKALGDIARQGTVFPDPNNQCLPWGVPYVLRQLGIKILQQRNHITILYIEDDQVRWVRMNDSHPAHVVPSSYGDSIGHYEGDTLVVDTIGIKAGPLSMIDWFGTPHSDAIHVVERYRLIDYEAAKEAIDRHQKLNGSIPSDATGIVPDPAYMGKALQIEFTVDDPNVFTMPWSGVVTYRRAVTDFEERICVENLRDAVGTRNVPTDDTPDF